MKKETVVRDGVVILTHKQKHIRRILLYEINILFYFMNGDVSCSTLHEGTIMCISGKKKCRVKPSLYIYIYVCVCVCVCVYSLVRQFIHLTSHYISESIIYINKTLIVT